VSYQDFMTIVFIAIVIGIPMLVAYQELSAEMRFRRLRDSPDKTDTWHAIRYGKMDIRWREDD
jgi:hypothetical protein